MTRPKWVLVILPCLLAVVIVGVSFMPTPIDVSPFELISYIRNASQCTNYTDTQQLPFNGHLYFDNNSVLGNYPCPLCKIEDLAIRVCTYKAREDKWVSYAFLRGDYFEGASVSNIIRMLRQDSGLQLVDIGANLGTYSLPASRISKVIAVEPNPETMRRLARSATINKLTKNIQLVFNAISNHRHKVGLGIHTSNRGHTFVNAMSSNSSAISVDTILLNDLLPLMSKNRALVKIDVEGHEIDVFTEETAGEFFSRIDVPLIQMEWKLIKKKWKQVKLSSFCLSSVQGNISRWNLAAEIWLQIGSVGLGISCGRKRRMASMDWSTRDDTELGGLKHEAGNRGTK